MGRMDFRNFAVIPVTTIRAMRKLIFILVVAMLSVGCPGGDNDLVYNKSTWRIVNSTDQAIDITYPPHGYVNTGTYDYSYHGISEWTFSLSSYGGTAHTFDMMRTEGWRGWADKNISFDVLSEDGTVLAKWNYSAKNMPGKQFFNPSTWRHTVVEEVSSVTNTWTFEILPKDLQ